MSLPASSQSLAPSTLSYRMPINSELLAQVQAAAAATQQLATPTFTQQSSSTSFDAKPSSSTFTPPHSLTSFQDPSAASRKFSADRGLQQSTSQGQAGSPARVGTMKRKHSQVGDESSSSSSDAGSGASAAPRHPPRPLPPNQPRITKRPTGTATLSEFSAYMMQFNISTDTEFAQKALESLHKKLKDRPAEMEAFIAAVDTGGLEPGGCVLVQRTLDGRLQVAGKKGFPHVIYGKLFRFDDTNKNVLKALPDICKHGFDRKEVDAWVQQQQQQLQGPSSSQQPSQEPPVNPSTPYVCVNPWHYEEAASVEYTPAVDPNVNAIVNKPSSTRDRPRDFQSVAHNYLPPSMQPQQQQQQPAALPQLSPGQILQQLQSQSMQASPLQLLQPQQQHQQLLRVLQQLQPTAAPAPAVTEASASADQQLRQQQQNQLLLAMLSQSQSQELARQLQLPHHQQPPLLQPTPPMPQLQLQQQLEPAPAAPAAAEEQQEELPKSEEFQTQWESSMSCLAPAMFYEWKTEERRLLSLKPPRFMPLKNWDGFEAWHNAHQGRLASGGIPVGWFDPKDTFIVSRDPAKQGFLKKYWPYPRREVEDYQLSLSAGASAAAIQQPAPVATPHQSGKHGAAAVVGDDVEDRRRRSVSTPIDPVSMDEEPSSSVSVASQPSVDESTSSAADSAPSAAAAAANAVAMAYSQQGHFSGQLQMLQQQIQQAHPQTEPSPQPPQHHQMQQQPLQPGQQPRTQPLSQQALFQPEPNLQEEQEEPSSLDP